MLITSTAIATVPDATSGTGSAHVPMRTCVGCRLARPKSSLVRVVAVDGQLRVDQRQRMPGRGAYVCPDNDCIDAASRRDGQPLARSLRLRGTAGTQRALADLRAMAVPGARAEEHTA